MMTAAPTHTDPPQHHPRHQHDEKLKKIHHHQAPQNQTIDSLDSKSGLPIKMMMVVMMMGLERKHRHCKILQEKGGDHQTIQFHATCGQ
jgi:hypothetical protein